MVIYCGQITATQGAAPMNADDYEYAGFWIRVWASIIDTALLMLVIFPLVVTVYGWNYFDTDAAFIRGPADFLISWLMPAAAVVLFWLYRRATPGKMAIDATIVDATTGAAITPRQALIRYLGYFVAGLPLALGLIWVAFDPRKQGWHDKMAGTVVIRLR